MISCSMKVMFVMNSFWVFFVFLSFHTGLTLPTALDSTLATPESTTDHSPCSSQWASSVCSCSGRLNIIDLDCSLARNETDLQEVFANLTWSNGTVLLFRSLEVHGSDIAALLPDQFADVSFNLLVLDGNNIKVVSNSTFQKSKDTLAVLNLNYNQLAQFPFSSLEGFAKLKVLKLGENRLTSVDADAFPDGLDSLAYVGLQSNNISSVGAFAFARLRALQHLDLSDNRLTTLGTNSIVNTVALKHVVVLLDLNRIEQVDVNAFNLTLPKLVSLANNNLTAFPEFIFRPLLVSLANSTGVLNVSGNNLTCDSTMSWTRNLTLAILVSGLPPCEFS